MQPRWGCCKQTEHQLLSRRDNDVHCEQRPQRRSRRVSGRSVDRGKSDHVVNDAIASRRPEDRAIALEKMRHAGAIVSGVEMIAYELLGRGGTPEFKAAQQYLKW